MTHLYSSIPTALRLSSRPLPLQLIPPSSPPRRSPSLPHPSLFEPTISLCHPVTLSTPPQPMFTTPCPPLTRRKSRPSWWSQRSSTRQRTRATTRTSLSSLSSAPSLAAATLRMAFLTRSLSPVAIATTQEETSSDSARFWLRTAALLAGCGCRPQKAGHCAATAPPLRHHSTPRRTQYPRRRHRSHPTAPHAPHLRPTLS